MPSGAPPQRAGRLARPSPGQSDDQVQRYAIGPVRASLPVRDDQGVQQQALSRELPQTGAMSVSGAAGGLQSCFTR
jgi:hypothetical protein